MDAQVTSPAPIRDPKGYQDHLVGLVGDDDPADVQAATPAARIGMHRERGPESYGLTFTLFAGHDRFHLAQARRALDQLPGPDPSR